MGRFRRLCINAVIAASSGAIGDVTQHRSAVQVGGEIRCRPRKVGGNFAFKSCNSGLKARVINDWKYEGYLWQNYATKLVSKKLCLFECEPFNKLLRMEYNETEAQRT
jgi:hypothetical protein